MLFKKIVLTIITFAFLINITACGKHGKTRYEAEFLVLFDTLTKIVAYTDSKEEFSKQSQLIYDSLKEYHELFDIYNDYPGINNIKTINDNAGIKPVKVDKRIIDLLLFAKDGYKKTNGRMNVAFGSVLTLWHDYREAGLEDEANAALPPMDKLQEASKHIDTNKVIIDEANSTIYLEDPDMSLDVGAVGKGYAVEQVAQIAIKNGFSAGLISVGGNVRAIGYKGENNELWNLGIQNPDKESEKTSLHIVNVTNASVVTSGDYDRYYTVNGKRYHHIIDPDTLFPSEYFTAVSIICPDSGFADVLSTAVFNMPFEEGLKFINELPDTEALWIMKNNEIRYSDNFKKFIKE
jgi:thiamine biosynthesis lipoprotein